MAQRVDLLAERLGGLVVEQVRLVDHDVLERRERLAGREQQGVVDAHEMRGLGAAAREPPVAAAPRGAVPAEAGGPRGTQIAGQLGQGRQLA